MRNARAVNRQDDAFDMRRVAGDAKAHERGNWVTAHQAPRAREDSAPFPQGGKELVKDLRSGRVFNKNGDCYIGIDYSVAAWEDAA
jgi:hypothetical protein